MRISMLQRRRMMIVIFVIGVLLSAFLFTGVVIAKDDDKAEKRKGPKVKLAKTGDGTPFIAGKISRFALEDGVEVYDRSATMFGILRAEAALMEAHGGEPGAKKSQQILKNLESDFFADIWINFEDNETTGYSIVTIRVGNETNILAFPTPGHTEIEKIEFFTRLIWDIAQAMYQAQQNQ